MKRKNKSCLGIFVIGLFTVYIFIVYRWFFRESADFKIQQDNLPTDSGMFEKKEWNFISKINQIILSRLESMHPFGALQMFMGYNVV